MLVVAVVAVAESSGFLDSVSIPSDQVTGQWEMAIKYSAALISETSPTSDSA